MRILLRNAVAIALLMCATSPSFATYTVAFSQGALGGSSSTLTAASPTPAPMTSATISIASPSNFFIGTGPASAGYSFTGPSTPTLVILNSGFQSTLNLTPGSEDALMIMNNVSITNTTASPIDVTIHLSENGYANLPTGNYNITNQMTVQTSTWTATDILMSSSLTGFPTPGTQLAILDPVISGSSSPVSQDFGPVTNTSPNALAHTTGNPFTIYTTIFIQGLQGTINFGNTPNTFTRLSYAGPLNVVPVPGAVYLLASAIPCLVLSRKYLSTRLTAN